MLKPKSILVPIDFSLFSEKAFRKALETASPGPAAICVLHVVDWMPLGVGDWMDEPEMRQFQEKLETHARGKLESFVDRFPEAKQASVEIAVRSGSPYEQIVKAAADRGADLIVMASHGKTGIKEHLLGGTAEKVLRHASCDVLVVRG